MKGWVHATQGKRWHRPPCPPSSSPPSAYSTTTAWLSSWHGVAEETLVAVQSLNKPIKNAAVQVHEVSPVLQSAGQLNTCRAPPTTTTRGAPSSSCTRCSSLSKCTTNLQRRGACHGPVHGECSPLVPNSDWCQPQGALVDVNQAIARGASDLAPLEPRNRWLPRSAADG